MTAATVPAGAAVLERRTIEILQIQDRRECELALIDFTQQILIPAAICGFGRAGADCYERISRHIESLPWPASWNGDPQ